MQTASEKQSPWFMQTANENQSSSSTNAYVLAEHRLLRETLVRLLGKKADIRVVGESRHCESTSAKIMASNCDVLLSDSLTTPRDTGKQG
jgi:DNA-binding NarL/FixJ family response regulator